MNIRRLFKAFQVISTVGSWFEKATANGKIDSKEAGELIEDLGEILGFEVKIDAPKK